MRARGIVVGLVAASLLALAGCSGTSGDAADGRIRVVASTNVYGAIAAAVGGDRVEVSSLIESAAQDPHEYEASVRDQLRVARADLVIANGGGFDPFMDGLVHASHTTATVITAATLSPEYPADGNAHADHDHPAGFNEHVFYDPAVMATLAQRIAADLGEIDPDGQAAFTANATTFAAGVDSIEASLARLKAAHEGTGVFVTEPLPLYLTDAAGLEDRTPPAFSEAVEEGQDVAPSVLLQALKTISAKHVALVIVNAQAGGPETDRVAQQAVDAGIPVLRFSELLPEGKTYLAWMDENVAQLARALG
ncbi:metal ABC transporter substrate-binding protein [Microbacterium sp. SYP-A9085]|uniref:metal ABC transporter solute-binding protein, Zn/Mn family n=1 Tax=Microbacterium sp. SYP-A9085 TaxID=2664454 RepID=UPI00129BB471|nr:zinc ABC transporter substrate-binding protein [Microbacterium sp. SYP-A9085]MRH28469.1 metal ABC transporter substrate-binding protein [Microbacterium sp. SYP-A9085]